MKKHFILILTGLSIGIGLISCSSRSVPQLTKEELHDHIEFLASDSLKGRYPGTAEDKIAAQYIASDLQNSGLELLFNEGLQAFEITTNLETGENNSLVINDQNFVLNEDFTPIIFNTNKELEAEAQRSFSERIHNYAKCFMSVVDEIANT